MRVRAAEVSLEPWQDDGRRRGAVLAGPIGSGNATVGVFECEPLEKDYMLEQNEIVYVVSGRATVTIENERPLELEDGDVAFLPAGKRSRWVFHTVFREVWVLLD